MSGVQLRSQRLAKDLCFGASLPLGLATQALVELNGKVDLLANHRVRHAMYIHRGPSTSKRSTKALTGRVVEHLHQPAAAGFSAYASSVAAPAQVLAAELRYVVIGTSAGGAEALMQLFKDLPADFPAAVLVVMHVGENRPMDWLAGRLAAGGRLPVRVARDGETICQGVGYIAPANAHLLIERERISLGHGAHEQRARPAIDVLFRSAAAELGPRAIGLILTGMLSDGTLGLRAIHDAGGITIVQEPSDAAHGEMPRNAMRDLAVDYCVKLSAVAPLLDLLVRRSSSRSNGVLETGLASSIRFLKERAAMLASLHAQSGGNAKTARFLADELAALKVEIEDIRRLIGEPAKRDR